MIVVMPNGSLPPPENMPAPPAAGAAPADAAAPGSAPESVHRRAAQEVVPLVEKTYRVKAGPREPSAHSPGSRWAAARRCGCSRRIPISLPTWASGARPVWRQRRTSGSSGTRPSWPQPIEVNRAIKRLEIVVGDQDFALNGSKALAEVFKKARRRARPADHLGRSHLDQLASLPAGVQPTSVS